MVVPFRNLGMAGSKRNYLHCLRGGREGFLLDDDGLMASTAGNYPNTCQVGEGI